MSHWSESSFFYHIYPLGFCGAPFQNDFKSQPVSRLHKIIDWLPYMKDLGINALNLGPVFESTSHGYDTQDYFRVDRRLGTNEDFKNLIAELHRNNIRVVLDGVFNHTGRDFWAFKDIQEKRGNSHFCGWFGGLDFNKTSPYHDPFGYQGWNGYYNLVKLNLKNQEVKNHLYQAVESWIRDFNIDGIRLDAADCLDFDFMKELKGVCGNRKNDFWLLGEIIHGDYRRWANKDTLDSVTNYEAYKGLYSSHNDSNFFEIAYSLNRQFGENGLYKNIPLYNFADNHDVDRVASVIKNRSHLFSLYCLLFTMPGIPSLYYGSEFGIRGIKENGSDQGLRPSLELDRLLKDHSSIDILDAVKKLAGIRAQLEALRVGNYRQLFLESRRLVFMRETSGQKVIVAVNASSEEFLLNLDLPELGNRVLSDYLNKGEKINCINGNASVRLYPNWGRVLVID